MAKTVKKPSVKKPKVNLLMIIMVIIAGLIIYNFYQYEDTNDELTYTEFVEKLEEDKVKDLKVELSIQGTSLLVSGNYNDSENTFTTVLPYSNEAESLIYKYQLENDYGITYVPEQENIILDLIGVLLIPILLMVVVIIFIRRQASGGGALEVGKSKARLSKGSNTKYKDVAGLEEEKRELTEVVDFLKEPRKFQTMGARIPKGVLLVGPPGTGKTLLAKAVSGEAGVPFFYISGSDFLEMFVGVGASRVRDMFKKAKAAAPCLIFIDEIDAVGRQRGAGLGGGNDEREQTLNQILVEMDGFDSNEGIIILAATNRADVLDPAILRPGRFDRQVIVNLPTVNGRREILELHASNKKFDTDVSFQAVAERTPGFSGADLENVLNEAALLAVRENFTTIPMHIIDEAIDRVLMGPAKKSRKYTEQERRLVAHHEAGHVVAGLIFENASEVHKVTIIPRGMAGGYAMMLPKEEKYFQTKSELLERINGLLAGRIAEELIFEEISTGAHNDFEQATKIARAMVTEYGMSDLGPIQWEQRTGNVFLGRDYMNNKNFSDRVANEIDQEVRKIINTAYESTTSVLKDNLELLKLIAENLLEKETLNKEEIISLFKNGRLPSNQENEVDEEKE